MKTLSSFSLSCLAVFSTVAFPTVQSFAQIGPDTPVNLIVDDSFSGPVIDSTVWTVVLPFADSQVTKLADSVEVKNRGVLIANPQHAKKIVVKSRVRFKANDKSSFKLVLHSDLTTAGVSEYRGIQVRIHVNTDWSGFINQFEINDWTDSVTMTRPISMDTWYEFSITDDGETVAVYIDDETTPVIQLTTSYRPGDHLVLYNREGSGGGSTISNNGVTEIDYVTLGNVLPTVVPKTAVYFTSEDLNIGDQYQMQTSSDLDTWTNFGDPFTADSASWRTLEYWDMEDNEKIFFRLQPVE